MTKHITLSPRDRRTLTIGAIGIATLLLGSRGVPAWRGWIARSRAIAAEKSDEAERTERMVQALPILRDSLAARNVRFLRLAPELLSGGSVNAAGVTLASLLSGAATDAGVKLGAIQLRSRESPAVANVSHVGSAPPSFLRIRVESDVTGDIRGISQFLLILERGPIHLIVRDLTINQPDVVGAPGRAEVLHATVAVEGLALATRKGS